MRLNLRLRNVRTLHIHFTGAADAPLRHPGGVGGQACIIYERSAFRDAISTKRGSSWKSQYPRAGARPLAYLVAE